MNSLNHSLESNGKTSADIQLIHCLFGAHSSSRNVNRNFSKTKIPYHGPEYWSIGLNECSTCIIVDLVWLLADVLVMSLTLRSGFTALHAH